MAKDSREFHWTRGLEKHFRTAEVYWDPGEAGAPTLNPDEIYPQDYQSMIEIALQHGELAAGEYDYEKPEGHIYLGHSAYTDDLAKTSKFRFTKEHRTLLKHLSIDGKPFDESGRLTPIADCKRPYGNFTYFEAELASHLGLPTSADERGVVQISKDIEEKMSQLHSESEVALQVYLRNFTLDEGYFTCPPWGYWVQQ